MDKLFYIVCSEGNAFSIFDVSDVSNPEIKAIVKFKDLPYPLEYPLDIFIEGNYAYITGYDNATLAIFDVSKFTSVGVDEGTIETNVEGEDVSILRQCLRINNPYSI